MKKLLGIAIVLAMMLSLVAVPTFAAGPTILVDFGDDADVPNNIGGNAAANAVDITYEDYYAEFVASGNDPYVSMDYGADDYAQVRYAKIRVYNYSDATAVEIFGSTSGRGLTGSECTHFPIQPNYDGWQTVIIDITVENPITVNAYKDPQYAIDECYWAGEVNWIRLDPMWQEGDDGNDSGGSMSSGDTIWIDYVAFFASEEDAKAFQSANEAASQVGFDTLDAAAASAGLTPLVANIDLGSITASEGNNNEGGENLFDNDTATKFCTGVFPIEATWAMDGAYNVNGIIFATANDNADYNGRNPETWTLSGSTDGSAWTVIATGSEADFAEVNFTYFPIAFGASSAAYSQFKLEISGATSGCMQVSEAIICGTPAGAAAAETPAAVVETPTEEAAPVVTTPAAAQTSDIASVAVIAAVLALGMG